MKEIVSIPTFPGYYADRQGNIYSVTSVKKIPLDKTERIEAEKNGTVYKSDEHGNFKIHKLKPKDNGFGYLQVTLKQGNRYRMMYVSRLVLMTFDKGRAMDSKTEQTDHINEDTHDNRLTNLQVVTPRENVLLSQKKKVKTDITKPTDIF